MPRDRGRRISLTNIILNQSRLEMSLQDGSVIIEGGEIVYDHRIISRQQVLDMASVRVAQGGGTLGTNHDPVAYERAKARKAERSSNANSD